MRYLIIVALLVLPLSAFAAAGAPPQSDGANVELTIDPWVDVVIDSATISNFTPLEVAATTAGNIDCTDNLSIFTNCTWYATVSAQTDLTGVDVSNLGVVIEKAGGAIAGAGTALIPNASTGNAGADCGLTLNYTREALNDTNGRYTGSVTVTVSH